MNSANLYTGEIQSLKHLHVVFSEKIYLTEIELSSLFLMDYQY